MRLSDILSSFHQLWETCQPLTGSSKQITERFQAGDVTGDLASGQGLGRAHPAALGTQHPQDTLQPPAPPGAGLFARGHGPRAPAPWCQSPVCCGLGSCGEPAGVLLETATDTAFHHFGAQTVSPAPTRELFVRFKDLFILLCFFFFFPNHPLQVLGEGSISFFLFPAHLPIPKTNILEQAWGERVY